MWKSFLHNKKKSKKYFNQIEILQVTLLRESGLLGELQAGILPTYTGFLNLFYYKIMWVFSLSVSTSLVWNAGSVIRLEAEKESTFESPIISFRARAKTDATSYLRAVLRWY